MQNVINFLNTPLTFIILGVIYWSGMRVSLFIMPNKRTKYQKILLIVGIFAALIMLSLASFLFLTGQKPWHVVTLPFIFFGVGFLLYMRAFRFFA